MGMDWGRHFKVVLGLKQNDINELMEIKDQKLRLNTAFMIWYKNKSKKAK